MEAVADSAHHTAVVAAAAMAVEAVDFKRGKAQILFPSVRDFGLKSL